MHNQDTQMKIVIDGYTATIGDLVKTSLVDIPAKITKLEDVPDNTIALIDKVLATQHRVAVRTEILNPDIVNRDQNTVHYAIQEAVRRLCEDTPIGQMYAVGSSAFNGIPLHYREGLGRFDKRGLQLHKQDIDHAYFCATLGRNITIESEMAPVVGYPSRGYGSRSPQTYAEDFFHGTATVLGVKLRFRALAFGTTPVARLDTDMLAKEVQKLVGEIFGLTGSFDLITNFDWYVPSVSEVIENTSCGFITLPPLSPTEAVADKEA